MKVLVPVKRVVDYNVKVRVKSDGTGVDIANVKMSMNPFDEIAVEEAVRLKEKGVVTEVIAVSCGVRSARKPCAPRWPSAPTAHPGGDRPKSCSRLRSPSCSRRWSTRNSRAHHPRQAGHRRRRNQTGQMLAALADLPQATFASKVEVADGQGQGHARSRRRPGNLSLTLPAVITTDLRLNEPRYVTLPNIMKAKKKQLDVFKPEDLGVDVKPRLKTLKVSEPPKRGAGIKVPDVATLVDKLKNEAKVI
jgi:electron transfer flavoprotein beta subunit